MKVLYVAEVLGLTRLHYYLKTENATKHDEYLLELLKENYLEDVSDVFVTDEDKDFFNNAFGFIEIKDKLYTMPSNWSDSAKKMRTDEIGIEIIKKYNEFLKNPMKLSFKEIKEEDFDRMYITEWDDGSESVLFTN